MKRLHDLRKQLPGKAQLNVFERMRIKGGEGDKRRDRITDDASDSGSGSGGNGDGMSGAN